jgi:hypothetical protein
MSPRRRRQEPRTLVDQRLEEWRTDYEDRLEKAADRKFPLGPAPVGFSPGSLVELVPLAFVLKRDLEADLREAEAKARRRAA